MKKKFTKYNKWGYALFASSVRKEGDEGVRKADRARETCRQYQKNKSLTRTKDGVLLDTKMRAMYGEIADGILAAYKEWEKGRTL